MLRRYFQTHPRGLAATGIIFLLAILSAWMLLPDSRTGRSLVRASYDWSQTFLPETISTYTPVVIVYLDLNSYLREKQDPSDPWSRALHAQLVRRLTAAGARAVVFDIIFGTASKDTSADREFAEALLENGRVVLGAELGRSSRETTQAERFSSLQLSLPAKYFLTAAAAWGCANAIADDDFVVRRQFNGFLDQAEPSLALATARLLGRRQLDASTSKWIRYYGKPLSIPHVSYSPALHADEVRDEFFRNKVVFIGARPMAGTILERKDEFRSPLTSWGEQEQFMPAVEVHATELINILQNDSLRRLPVFAELLSLMLSGVAFGWLFFFLRPLMAAGAALASEFAVLGLVVFVLSAEKVWFPWLIASAVQIPVALSGSVLFQSLEWYRQKRRFEERRHADEAKIREQAALIEKAQDAIVVEDIEGRVIYANPGAERLFGWSGAELKGEEAVRRIISASEKLFGDARQAALTKGDWQGELELTARDGRILKTSSTCTLIANEQGRPRSLLFIHTDITERKRLELEFFRAQRIESIGALASGMAHDLNNALSPILMGLQLLQDQGPDEETRRMLSVMTENTRRGADMVRQVLLFSRGRKSEMEPLSIGSLVREMERIVRQTFQKSINVASLVPADLWTVSGNATQIHQVLLNLCVNARDAMPQGGELTLAADNVELSAEEAGRLPRGVPGCFVMVLVSDTGSGIAPEIAPRIFEPFFTTKSVGKGTGLGLSTIARIVSQHGGFMNLKSEPGNGAVFEIYLPKATNAETTKPKPLSPAELPRGNNELILVVDDEKSVREMISLGLASQGYRIVTAADGAEAIAVFERTSGDVRLVLMDTDMPVLDGPFTIPRLRAINPSVPVILMSGELESNSNQEFAATLIKPFQLQDLLRAVTGQLEGESGKLNKPGPNDSLQS